MTSGDAQHGELAAMLAIRSCIEAHLEVPAVSAEAKRPRKEGEDAMQGKLFPHQHMYRWLAYGNDGKHPQADPAYFQKREFCFTLDGDIFVRYQSFKDGTEMREAIKARCPSKIDIGPLYSCNPKDRLKFGAGFFPVERELVFDIDLTDYDDVRTCGNGGHICNKCWPLMAVAVQIVDRGLREDFGFKHILWVYSGRRGIHCWVCDPSARRLTDEQRASIANYFAVYKGHENDRIKLATGVGATMHPAVTEAVAMLKNNWEENILPLQQLLENETMRCSMLKLLPDKEAEEVRAKWDAPQGRASKANAHVDVNLARWRQLEEVVERKLGSIKAPQKQSKEARQLARCVDEIMLAFSYPRLDMEVSKKMNHLLKAPFCVHPKTGKVCVPIDPAKAFDFDPDNVPTVHSLLEQIKKAQQQQQSEDTGDLWQHTAMAESVKLFQNLFLNGCLAAGRAEMAARARAVANQTDFTF